MDSETLIRQRCVFPEIDREDFLGKWREGFFLQQFITFRKGTYFKTFSASGNGKKKKKKKKEPLKDLKLFLK